MRAGALFRHTPTVLLQPFLIGQETVSIPEPVWNLDRKLCQFQSRSGIWTGRCVNSRAGLESLQEAVTIPEPDWNLYRKLWQSQSRSGINVEQKNYLSFLGMETVFSCKLDDKKRYRLTQSGLSVLCCIIRSNSSEARNRSLLLDLSTSPTVTIVTELTQFVITAWGLVYGSVRWSGTWRLDTLWQEATTIGRLPCCSLYLHRAS